MTNPQFIPLAPRLAVVSVLTNCTGKREHEVRFITDGQSCYAYGTGPDGIDLTGATRDGTLIEVACTHPDAYDEPCNGYVEVDVDGPVWTTNTEALELLAEYGTAVDR